MSALTAKSDAAKPVPQEAEAENLRILAHSHEIYRVLARRDHLRPIGPEGDPVEAVLPPPQHEDIVRPARIPELHQAVEPERGDGRGIRAPGDIHRAVGMPAERGR